MLEFVFRPSGIPAEFVSSIRPVGFLSVAWQETSLYISGFKTQADMSVMNDFTECHLTSSGHSNHEFLPWHREFVYLEEVIRGLGGDWISPMSRRCAHSTRRR